MSTSEEQLGNLSDVSLSTFCSNLFGSYLDDILFKSTLDLKGDIDLNMRSHFRQIYVCVLVGFNLYY